MMRYERMWRVLAVLAALVAAPAAAQDAGAPDRPVCVFPAAPHGGLDATCRIAAALLNRGWDERTLAVEPGSGEDLGATRFRAVTEPPLRGDANQLTAFSTGTLRNLAAGAVAAADGRPLDLDDVRWVARIGTDHGAVFVAEASPWANLPALVDALRADPRDVTFGGSGDRGDMDFAKVHRLVGYVVDPDRAEGVRNAVEWRDFASGGEAMAALVEGEIDVYVGDLAEWTRFAHRDDMRVLAVLARNRLPPPFAHHPTAWEQGVAMEWSITRGLYLPPDVPETSYRWWVDAFDAAFTAADRKAYYRELAHDNGLRPDGIAGEAVRTAVDNEIASWRTRLADANPEARADYVDVLLAGLRNVELWTQILAYLLGGFIVAAAASRQFAEPTFKVAAQDGGLIWPVPPRYTTPRLTYTGWLVVFVGLALIVFVLLVQALPQPGSELTGVDPWMKAYPPLVAAALLAGAAPVVPGAQAILREFRDFCHRSASIPDSAQGRYAALRDGVETISAGDVVHARRLVGEGVLAPQDFHDRRNRPAWRLAQALHLIAAAKRLGESGGGRYAQTLARPELRLAELEKEALVIGRTVRPDDGERRFEPATVDRIERLYDGALQLLVCLVHACERNEADIARRLTGVGFNAGVATVGIRFALTPIAFVGIGMFVVTMCTSLVLWWTVEPEGLARPANARNAALVLWLLLWVPAVVVFVWRQAASETWWPFRMPWDPRNLRPLTLMTIVGLGAGVAVMGGVELLGILGDDQPWQQRMLFAFLGSVVAGAAAFALDEPLGETAGVRGWHMARFVLVTTALLVIVTFMGMFLFEGRPPLREDLFVYAFVGSVGLVLGAGLWVVAGASTQLLGVEDAIDYALVRNVARRLEEVSNVPLSELDRPAVRALAPRAVALTARPVQTYLARHGVLTAEGDLSEAGARRFEALLHRAYGLALCDPPRRDDVAGVGMRVVAGG